MVIKILWEYLFLILESFLMNNLYLIQDIYTENFLNKINVKQEIITLKNYKLA